MPDVIQFNCPACATALKLPLALAAVEGPCPCCGRAIVAPDPENGLNARKATEPSLPGTSRPISPVEETPDVIPDEAPDQNPAPATSPGENTPDSREVEYSPNAPPQTALPVLSVLLTGTLCLIAGYLFGARSVKTQAPETPPPAPSVSAATNPPATNTTTPDEESQSAPNEPTETPPESIDMPGKASAAAEAALRAFLDAPDWASRSAHVLDSEKLRDDMEAYSHNSPDGPTPYTSISVRNSYTDNITGNTLFIYQLITGQHPEGFPVAVSEASGAWLVDWQAFVEFRDDHFAAFADGPAGKSGNFHLLVTTPPAERAMNTENIHFSSFIIEAPLPDRQRLAYVRKSSEIHAALTAATANGRVFTPVLEVTKQKTPDERTFLEITGIQATDWLPDSL